MSVGVVNNWGWASSTLSDAENVFLEAIKTGNTQKIQELIASGTDINEKLDCDMPLAIAVSHEQPEVIRLLLDNQADFTALSSMDRYRLLFLFRTELQSFITKYNIDVQAADEHGISLIQRAIFQGDLEFFKIFLQISGRLKNDIIHEVVQNCSVEFLQYLIQEGYDINALNASGEPLIVSAVRSGNEEMVRALVDAGIDINAVTVNGKKISLYDYIPSGNREMFQMLVACNASFQETTEEGDTELHKAVRNGDISKIRSLIAAGIDVNVQNEAGNTAMHLAMEENHQVAYVLMSECRVHNVSLNLNLQNYDGNTPFHFLVTKQSRISALLPIMLENGANINVQNNEGNTPLHFAGKLLNLEAIQLFLANGANPYIQNFWGNTPYHFVHSHRINPRLTRSVWECIALFNDKNIDIRRLLTTENKSGQSIQSMGREEFQFPLIDESSIPRIYSIPRPQTPSSAMPAPIDFDAPMVSNGPPIPILPPEPLEESNIPILPVQVEPMQHSGSDISPMMDPPPLNPTPPMPPMDKEEIKHEDVPLSVDAVPPAPQNEIPLPQPTSTEMPPPPVQVEPMQHSGSDISPMMDPPPLNPTPPMPPMDKEEIKHEDVPLSVDAVPPAPQSEIPLPQPTSIEMPPPPPVQVEPMQHSGSDISPMMDPPPLNPTPPMPPMDKEEIKHEDVPLSVDAVPPAPQSEIPLPQPTSTEMPPPPPVQVEPMQHSESDISPMMDPPPLNPTPPMPPMDKEEIKHEDVPLSVDAVPPAPQSEIPLPQPTSTDIIMSEQSNSFVLESVVPISINTDVLASTTNIPVPEPLSVESIISTEDVSGEGNSLENDAVVDSNEHNSLIGRDVITDNLGEPSVQSNLLHGQGNGKPPIGIAATEIVPFSTSGINNTLIENNHQIDNDGLNRSRENTSLGENVNTENRQEEITNNFDERDNESRHTATSGKQNELKNSENGVNTGEHLSSQGNGFSHVSGAGERGDDRIGRGTPLSCHGKSGVCSGENSKGNESGTGTEPPLLGCGNGAGSAEQNDGREDDGFPMNGLSCKEDDDSENRRVKSKKKKQKSVEFFIPPIIPEESENKDDLMCFDPGVVCENSQGMQIVNRKRKNEKKRIDITNISPEKLNFWERNWKWIVGVATVVVATLGAYFLIRKAKKKTKAVKSETERLKSQIKTLQRSISDMTNGVSDKDIQKPSVLSNNASSINNYSQLDVVVGVNKQNELF